MNLSAVPRLLGVLLHRTQRRFIRRLLSSPTQRRHALEWVRSTAPGYLMDAPSPWIVFDAIDYIKSRLGKETRVFEYGSGGSTLFWLSNECSCVSVEHDPEWHGLVRGRIAETSSLDYRLVPPEPVVTAEELGDPADPHSYRSDDINFTGCSFRKYVSRIDSFPDGSFDVVLIDGRARPSCIMHSAGKVRIGGLLVLDNADRDYYTRNTHPYLDGYTATRFHGAVPSLTWFSVTDIYTRVR